MGVELDLKDKNEALDIDMQQLDLTESSAGISHKPDAVRVPKEASFLRLGTPSLRTTR